MRAVSPASTRRRAWLSALPLLACMIGCTPAARPAKAAPPLPVAVTTRADIAYGPLPEERGDLYLPMRVDGRLRRAVVMIHGGGWVSGQRSTNQWFSELIAARDFVVFNIDYRLARQNVPESRWPGQLVDAQLAVRWLRANAASLGVDPARIGAVGDSAGGTLAVLLGVLHAPVAGDEAGLLGQEQTDVAVVVDQFGITDLAAMGESAVGLVELMFGSRVPPPGELESVSPLPMVNARSAPMLVVHGLTDTYVPIGQSERLVSALRSKGVSAQLMTYSGGHGFEGVRGEDILEVFNREIAWLEQRLPR